MKEEERKEIDPEELTSEETNTKTCLAEHNTEYNKIYSIGAFITICFHYVKKKTSKRTNY
jgi:hypothetical protein